MQYVDPDHMPCSAVSDPGCMLFAIVTLIWFPYCPAMAAK